MGSGQGHSKKEAKQAAAKDLLEQLDVETSRFESQQNNRYVVFSFYAKSFVLQTLNLSGAV